MKITREDGRTFEYLVDGESAEDKDAFDAFVTLGSVYFPLAVVTRRVDAEQSVRAVTFAADEDYVETLVAAFEDETPISLMEFDTSNGPDPAQEN